MNNTMTIGTQNNKGQIIGKVVDDNFNSFEVEGENFVEGKLLIDRLSENSDILPFENFLSSLYFLIFCANFLQLSSPILILCYNTHSLVQTTGLIIIFVTTNFDGVVW